MGIIDFHCDTASRIYINQTDLYTNDYHVDIRKLRESNYYGQWFAFWFSLLSIGEISPMDKFLEMYRYFRLQVNKYSEEIEVVTSHEEYLKARQANKIAAFLSIEEGQIIEGKIENIDKLEQLGIRLMTLTWNYANDLAHPHSSKEGLTRLGKEVVECLNEKKIMLDISHLSDTGIDQVLDISKKPIVASHSNARSAWNHTRNLQDKHLKQIANGGGVVGVNFYTDFFSDRNITKVEDIHNMISYMVKVLGEDSLVIGADFDGGDWEVEVFNCSKMDRLRKSLLKEYSNTTIDKIFYKNAERFIKENM